MKAESVSIETLFKENTFNIPLYQRPYCWSKELCSALWEDFKRIYDSVDNHYLGTLVVEAITNKDNCYNIVDGQQRVTSLMLMIKALSAQFENKLDYLIKKGEEFRLTPQSLENNVSNENLIGENKQFKDTKDGENTNSASVFNNNFKYFKNKIEEESAAFNSEKIKAAIKAIEVVFIELEKGTGDNDNSQLIFEKMNGGGKNLEVHDLIRNYIFMLAAESNNPENGNQKQRMLYENEWRNLENEFPERRLFQMKYFFRDYLILKTKDIALKSNKDLYQKFKEWLHQEKFEFGCISEYETIEKLVNDLWRYADYWCKALFPEHNGFVLANKSELTPKIQQELNEYAMIGNVTTHPLMIEILKQKEKHPIELIKLLKWLNKFIGLTIILERDIDIRKDLFGDGGLIKNIDNIDKFQEILYSLIKDSDNTLDIKKEITESVNTTILIEENLPGKDKNTDYISSSENQTKDLHNNTSDNKETINEEITLPDIYSKGKKAVFILLKINSKLTGNDSQVEFATGTKHSLEHIMPQTPEEDWSKIIKDSDIHQKYLNTLGNMTLVSQSYNSKISNKPFSDKVKFYKKSSYEITRQIAQEYSDWNNQKESSEQLYELINNLELKADNLGDQIRSRADDFSNAIQNNSKSLHLENMFKKRANDLTKELVEVFKWEINQ